MEIYWICSGGCRRQRIFNSIEEGDLIFGGEYVFFFCVEILGSKGKGRGSTNQLQLGEKHENKTCNCKNP